MRILLLILGLAAVVALIWVYLRWTQTGLLGNGEKSDDAAHYASLLNLYAQDYARHLDAAKNPERSWKDRMERLNQAKEAKQQHAQTLGEAPTDMRGQDLDSPPSADLHSLRRDLVDARKGHPDLPWQVLDEHEQIAHAQMLDRAATHLRTYGDTTSADELDARIEEINEELVRQQSDSPTPYLQLLELYQRQNDRDREAEVLQRALDQAKFDSDKQHQALRERLEKVKQLRGA